MYINDIGEDIIRKIGIFADDTVLQGCNKISS